MHATVTGSANPAAVAVIFTAFGSNDNYLSTLVAIHKFLTMTATVLLVATATRWLGTARIRRGLAKAGFEVALLTPRNSSQTGLATVVRYIHQAEVARFSAMLVEGFAMSGFSGIEFRVEETTGEAYLLEINRRITPGVRGVRTGGHAAGDRRPAASGGVRAMQAPVVRERRAGLGMEPVGSAPAEFAAQLKEETLRWSALVRDAGVRPE